MGFFNWFKKKKRYVSKLTIQGHKRPYHLGDEDGHWLIFYEQDNGDHKVIFRSSKTGDAGHSEAVSKLHHYALGSGPSAAAKMHHYRYDSPHKQARKANRSAYRR